MSWEDVRKLRQDEKLDEARQLARELLTQNPADFRVKTQYEWVIFGMIKRSVTKVGEALKKGQLAPRQDIEDVMTLMREYHQLRPRIPDMSCSTILGQLVKVGPHLPKLPGIIRWVGINGLRQEDWAQNEYQGKTYPSLALYIARSLSKWVKAHPDASDDDIALAFEWAERVKAITQGDDTLWLNWDIAILLRKMGKFHNAAELLTGVIKAKRNEFWVWAEAGRLYEAEQPELALACFCRALECPAEPKFLVRAHFELAMLLAEQGEVAQASREIATVIDIRQAEGWPMGSELEELIASHWYDPAAEGAENPKDFYARHSTTALSLCFDLVETRIATYLGMLTPHRPKDAPSDWKAKPLPRYAARDSTGASWSHVAPRLKGERFKVGDPLTVVIGRQTGSDRETIVHIAAREDGEPWDCLDSGIGVVTRDANSEHSMKVLLLQSGEEINVGLAPTEDLRIGDGVLAYRTCNPKNNKAEAFIAAPSRLHERDIRQIHGKLQRTPKGFAFVDDAFAPPHVASLVPEDVEDVSGVAVFAKNISKGEFGWRIVTLKEA